MSTPEWMERVKATIGIETAASSLGLKRGRMSSFGPCPLCGTETRGSNDSRLPVGVGRERGKWHCWKCNGGGDVLDLVSAVRFGSGTDGADAGRWAAVREACAAMGWCDPAGREPERKARRSPGAKVVGVAASVRRTESHERRDPGPDESAPMDPGASVAAVERLHGPDGELALDYLRGVRLFTDDTIREWGLGSFRGKDGQEWVTIPLLNTAGALVNIRLRSIPPACPERSSGLAGCDRCDQCKAAKAYRVLPNKPLPLFGAHRLPEDTDQPVIITEGELDVVALWQYGYRGGVVSGTGGATTLKEEWLDELEPYRGFILAHDSDAKGDEGAAMIAERLGRYRCSRVALPRKDAGECLASGIDGDTIERAINRSRGMLATEITSVGVFEDDIERMVERPAELVGRPTASRRLNRALGGIRPGLIIVTGETGQGKTTFTTWLLDEQSRSGVPSLLTSFEQSPIGTVQKLLRAELGGDFTQRTTEERRAAMRAIDERCLSIVRHRGQLPFGELHDLVRYAVRRLGVKNVLIDHLGFIVDPDSEDERREIQTVCRALSIIGEHEGVAIFLICHPSNQHVQQRRRVTLADLKGASAIRQDAHEVWVVEAAKPTTKRPFPAAWIHLDKIRSDFGASGVSVLLAFDPLSTTYADSWEETPSGKRGVRVTVPTAPKGDRKGKGRKAKLAAKTEAGEGPEDDDEDEGEDENEGSGEASGSTRRASSQGRSGSRSSGSVCERSMAFGSVSKRFRRSTSPPLCVPISKMRRRSR